MGSEYFEVGDVVCTLPLGCEATVLSVNAGIDCEGSHHSCEKNFLCGWWDEVGERYAEWFNVQNLRLIKRSSSKKVLPVRRDTNFGHW